MSKYEMIIHVETADDMAVATSKLKEVNSGEHR
jgi:hypothetical protein